MVDIGWNIYRAEKSRPWEGTASLEVSLLWVGHTNQDELRILDDVPVASITPALDPESRVRGNPYRLAANADLSFQGTVVLGSGFILSPREAEAFIAADPRNEDVLFPYLNGEDLNSRWDCSASRWIINFHDWPIERAREYPEPYAIVDRNVRPLRAQSNRKMYRERWWQYAEKQLSMQHGIANLDRVLVIALVSKTGLPLLVPNGQVFSHMLGVFTSNQVSDLALLSSSIHFSWWTTKGESTLETRLRYTPSDGFETFPQPAAKQALDRLGKQLDNVRRSIMMRRGIGLTNLYNEVNKEDHQQPDVIYLREIHAEIDEAVREAYALDEEREPAIREFEARIVSSPLPAWRDIDLGHGFHETRQGVRFTISPQARIDVLDKLLALNHYRYRQEQERGLHNKKSVRKKRPASPPNATSPELNDGTLLPPDALF